MTAEREEPGHRNGQKLDDIVQDADEYYNYLKEKHVQQTRLDAIIVSLTVWFGAFVALGVGAYTTIQGSALIGYLYPNITSAGSAMLRQRSLATTSIGDYCPG